MYKNCFMAWLSPLAGVLLLSNLNIFEQVFGRRRESTPRFKPLFVARAPASMGKKQGKIFTEFSRTVSYLSDISPFSTTLLSPLSQFLTVAYSVVRCRFCPCMFIFSPPARCSRRVFPSHVASSGCCGARLHPNSISPDRLPDIRMPDRMSLCHIECQIDAG